MFVRIANGWALARQSFRVLRLDKELLLFPLMSGLSCLLVLASFVFPLWRSGAIDAVMNERRAQVAQEPLAWVVLFAFYFVNYLVMVFFNSALIECAVIRFRGGDPTVGDGLRAAVARLPQIVGWALVSATVGVVLRAIESQSERAGRFVAGLLGMAWSAATYFVVPVLVMERVGPLEAVKRSFAVLRKAWGEAITANFSIGLIVFVAQLVALVPLAIGAALGGSAGLLIGAAVTVAASIVIGLISATLNTIIQAAVYLYAAQGRVPQQFDAELWQRAFVRK